MSAKNQKVDRDALHQYLEERRNNRGLIVVRLALLAADLDVRPDHMSRILKEFLEQGRLVKVARSGSELTYRVIPFEEWAEATGYKIPRRRRRAG